MELWVSHQLLIIHILYKIYISTDFALPIAWYYARRSYTFTLVSIIPAKIWVLHSICWCIRIWRCRMCDVVRSRDCRVVISSIRRERATYIRLGKVDIISGLGNSIKWFNIFIGGSRDGHCQRVDRSHLPAYAAGACYHQCCIRP